MPSLRQYISTMRLRHAPRQSDCRRPVSSLVLSLVSLPAHPTRDHLPRPSTRRRMSMLSATCRCRGHAAVRGGNATERSRCPRMSRAYARTRAERCHAACTRRVCPALVRVLSGYAEGSLSGAGWRQPPPVPTLQVPYIPIPLSLLYHIHIPLPYPTRGSCKAARGAVGLHRGTASPG